MELRSVDALMAVLRACEGASDTHGATGEPVDLHDHALQTAALLRRGRPSDKELQIAGLVHDIGHVLRPGDDAGHARCAADAVRGLLGERVARLVLLHVAAERYLAAVEPGRALSPRGARTLRARGGPMAPDEAAAFAADPLCEDAVTLRQADDAAKVAGLDAGVLDDWRPVLELVAAGAHRQGFTNRPRVPLG
ncbi:HD domain-containing protein [Streptomyces beihaiensis]|uniref:HD domain-containing protein n=1 Tax=Streptomyces beihaiensis TaxID=2984495 RepID=A0ABT3U5Q1_9ACTN|nr:HD domain-containing protein [Streptomyces beihaiensis]MCX3063508.1 HD domain-containing protein [Streptomyces beihaiensis]